MKHFKPYDFTLTGNGSQEIAAAGRVLKLLSATSPVFVRVDHGSAIKLSPGQGVELPDDEEFSTVTVINSVATANSGQLFIAAGRHTDQTLQGVVSALLSSDIQDVNSLLSNRSFGGGTSFNHAGAGSAQHYLYNPAGSGVNLSLRQVFVEDSASAAVSVRKFLKADGTGAIVGPTSKPTGLGSSASKGLLNSTVALSYNTFSPFVQSSIGSVGPTRLLPIRGVVLEPGQCFVIDQTVTAACNTTISWLWDELPI